MSLLHSFCSFTLFFVFVFVFSCPRSMPGTHPSQGCCACFAYELKMTLQYRHMHCLCSPFIQVPVQISRLQEKNSFCPYLTISFFYVFPVGLTFYREEQLSLLFSYLCPSFQHNAVYIIKSQKIFLE